MIQRQQRCDSEIYLVACGYLLHFTHERGGHSAFIGLRSLTNVDHSEALDLFGTPRESPVLFCFSRPLKRQWTSRRASAFQAKINQGALLESSFDMPARGNQFAVMHLEGFACRANQCCHAVLYSIVTSIWFSPLRFPYIKWNFYMNNHTMCTDSLKSTHFILGFFTGNRMDQQAVDAPCWRDDAAVVIPKCRVIGESFSMPPVSPPLHKIDVALSASCFVKIGTHFGPFFFLLRLCDSTATPPSTPLLTPLLTAFHTATEHWHAAMQNLPAD